MCYEYIDINIYIDISYLFISIFTYTYGLCALWPPLFETKHGPFISTQAKSVLDSWYVNSIYTIHVYIVNQQKHASRGGGTPSSSKQFPASWGEWILWLLSSLLSSSYVIYQRWWLIMRESDDPCHKPQDIQGAENGNRSKTHLSAHVHVLSKPPVMRMLQ